MFKLGSVSQGKLKQVHPDLVKVVEKAISLSKVDFCVQEGARTEERQQKLVAAGASKTENSRHLLKKSKNVDHLISHAVDLVPMIDFDHDGKLDLRWDWNLCYLVAEAMQAASEELGVPLVWGGVWDRSLDALGNDLEEEVAQYVLRRKALGKKAFTDGPHFELPWAKYPILP